MKTPAMSDFTTKRALIDKANTVTVIAAGAAAFLVVFSLISAKSFVSQIQYQNKVIGAKRETLKTLKGNLEARDTIVKAYNSFSGTSTNIIAGSTTDDLQDNGGDNARLILDALPSKYDFPALTTSLEKLAAKQNVKIQKLSGVDDEVAQAAQQKSANPSAIPIPFSITIAGDYTQLKVFVEQLEKSIRPVQVQKFSVAVSEGNLEMTIDAQTFYQPEKVLEIRKVKMSANGTIAKSPAATDAAAPATGSTGATTSTAAGAAQ
jgi:Tfp pilus assembly protein PilO